MANVPAKLRIKGKSFEILVDVDKAMQLRQGKPVSMANVIATDCVFHDLKKGLRAGDSDLTEAFGTVDINVIAERIIKNGEVNIPQEYRDNEREVKIKQVVDFLSKNALDPVTNKPHTPSRISDSLKQAGVNIDNRPIEEQMSKIIEKLRPILPIKIETKKLSIRIPAIHTGKAYGVINEFKEKEDWLNNGDLQVVVNIPAGMVMSFYDKLNSVTHGSAIAEEIKS